MRLQNITIVKLSSIMVIFLLLNLPIVFATEISLVFGGESRTFSFTANKFINKIIDVKSGRVFLNITANRDYSIRRVLLFPCRGLSPMECIRKEPIEYESYSDTYINLRDAVENGKGSIMTLVMLNTTSWIGFWDSYENGNFRSRDLGSLDLDINTDTGEAEKQISDYGMIPVNWVEDADFKGKGLYQIEAEKVITEYGESLNFTRTLESGNLTDTRNYLFAFPKDSRVYNPLTFYYQPPVECGNFLCELGESQATCCRDCGCPENQSCSRTGCVPSSDIRLVLDSMEPSPLLECYIYENECTFQDLLELKLHIENAPLNYWINDYFFIFGNQSYKGMACLPEEEGLDCTILLPRMNRNQSFQEKRILSLYLSIGYMEMSETRTEEISLDIGLDITGKDLGEELDLQSLRDKLAQMTKTMEKINAILKVVKTLMMIYNAWTLFNFMQAGTHAALFSFHADAAKACAACCGPYNPACCACIDPNAKLAALHKKLEISFLARAKYTTWMLVQAEIAMMIIEALIKAWAEYEMGRLEDRLKQKIERIDQDTMSIVGDDVIGTIPLLVWANGNFSGKYTKTVCNSEILEIRYDFTPLNCSGGLWLTPEGMVKQEANTTGEHLLLSKEADQLFQGRNSMTMEVECNSTRYYNIVSDIIPFLNYTESCEEIPEPIIELERPSNGTIQTNRNITLAYSVSHPLKMNSCNILVNDNLVQSRTSPETDREYEFSLYDLLPGSYKWKVECDDILGTSGSSGEYEFRIGGSQ